MKNYINGSIVVTGHGKQPAGLASYQAKKAAAELAALAPYSIKKDTCYSSAPWHVYDDGKALCEFFETKKAAVAWIIEQKKRRETISSDAAPAAVVDEQPEQDPAPAVAVIEQPEQDPAPAAQDTDENRRETISSDASALAERRHAPEKPPRGAAPEKPFAGDKICGQGWTIVFDIALQRTRVIVQDENREQLRPIIENAGFYYSKNTDSWHKKLTFKAQRAAVALAENLRAAVA